MMKIMIVDDDFVVLNGMVHLINERPELDCRVVGTANDGAEALVKIETLRPDVVFTDVVMPRMSGLELLEQIDTLYPNIHVVIVSAYDEAAYVRQSMKDNAVEYLLKPCKIDEIAAVIEKIRSRMQNEAMLHTPEDIKDDDYNRIKSLMGEALSALQSELPETVEAKTRQIFAQVEKLQIRSMLFLTSSCVELLTQAINIVKKMLPDEQSLEIRAVLNMISHVHNMEQLKSLTIRAMVGMSHTICENTAEMTKLVRQACEIIEKQYMENLTIQQIADVLHVSVNYLQNRFKQENNTTIRQYLTDVRIARAKHLLRRTNDKVAAICEQVGYKDTDYFTRVFRESTGLTPNEYRRSNLR